MANYKYLYLPISFLEFNNISKESFMENSAESQAFLTNLLSKIPPFLELKNTYLINKTFVLTFENKKTISFDNTSNFQMFSEFIKKTPFNSKISIDNEKKEISINNDIPQFFYNLLYEFLV